MRVLIYPEWQLQTKSSPFWKNIILLKKSKPDLILVMGWSQLLKDELIDIPKIGIIGSHPTELPKYRGRAPIPWTILKGLTKSALTFFWIDKGVDDGDILDQEFFSISDSFLIFLNNLFPPNPMK